jgi:hypothetical protein
MSDFTFHMDPEWNESILRRIRSLNKIKLAPTHTSAQVHTACSGSFFSPSVILSTESSVWECRNAGVLCTVYYVIGKLSVRLRYITIPVALSAFDPKFLLAYRAFRCIKVWV